MKTTRILLLLPILWLLQGCGTTWNNVDKTLAATAQIATEAKDGYENLKAKYADLEAKLIETQKRNAEKLAALGIPLDADGDGDVTVAEGKAALKKLSETQDGRKLLFDPEVLMTIITAIAGLGIAKKGGGALLKQVHLMGRAKADGSK